jgi:hypothetical protein
MGIFNKIRGGAGSNHYSGRGDYPYAGDGAPAQPTYGGNDFANEVSSAPKAGPAPAQPAPSGRGKYKIHGKDGGGYVTTTPSQGKEGRHDVTYWSDDNKEQYSVSGANFQHDADKGTASFYGGKEQGSGKQMGHMWSKSAMSGNLHRDNEFG